MRQGCAACLCLLACVRASDNTTPKKACSSSLKGDFPYQSCSGFCKDAKKGNHCKFCKCKACTFCAAGSDSSASAPPALSASFQKMKKGRSTSSSVGKKSKCQSDLKGDLPFMACGSFCKAAKAGNHCKLCKCRTCPYCTAEGTQKEGYVATEAPVPSTPRHAPGGASVGTAASATPSAGLPQRGVPIDTAAKTGGSHMWLIQGLGISVLLVLLGLGLVAFTSQGDATVGSWQHTVQTHLAKMGLADYGREGSRLNPEGSSSNLDEAFRAVDKLEADMDTAR